MTANAKRYDKDTVKQAARGRCVDILCAALGWDRELFGSHQSCPKCGGNDRFRTFDDVNETGGAVCSQCGKFADIFATIKHYRGCDFLTAVALVAEYLGIEPKNSTPRRDADPAANLEFNVWSSEICSLHIHHKPGFTEAAILAAGGRMAMFKREHKVIAFPIIGETLDTTKPVGWLLVRATGGTLPKYNPKTKSIEQVKVRLTKGSSGGLVGLAAIERLKSGEQIDLAWKCEGLSDLLAVASIIPSDFTSSHIAITNACGADENPKWMGRLLATRCKQINVLHDCDQPGQRGAAKWCKEIANYNGSPKNIDLGFPVTIDHGKDARDFLNEGHGYDDLVALDKNTTTTDYRDKRPQVLVTPDEFLVNNIAAAELRRDPELFQRGGKLVSVPCGAESKDDVRRSVTQPQIVPVTRPTLRSKLTELCYFVVEAGEESIQVKPPQDCVNAIFDRGVWPGVPPLVGIALSPMVRSDGSILCTRGYDSATGLYLAGAEVAIDVADQPSQLDAKRASEELLGPVCDFPFEKDSHKSAYLSIGLTMLARAAFDGPAPLHLIDANVRGCGKTCLADLWSLIIHGDEIAKMTNPRDDDEARKAITSVCIAGDPLILIDNINGSFGGPVFDAVLTSTKWRDRKLSKNEMINMPMLTCWIATGNNIVLRGDTSRRVLHIRLQSSLEQPESRTGFKHENVRQYVQSNRGRLLSAALTILRAYFVAGQPRAKLPAWGSFEGWSNIVRQALVFAGQPDPNDTRKEMIETSDTEANALGLLIENWPAIDPNGEGLTSGEISAVINGSTNWFDGISAVRDSFIDLCQSAKGGTAPAPKQIGQKLKQLRRRVIDDRYIDYVEGHARVRRWKVFKCESVSSPLSPSLSSVPNSNGDNGDSGDAVSTPLKESRDKSNNTYVHTYIQQATETVSPSPPSSPVQSDSNGQWDDQDLVREYDEAAA